MDYLPSSSSTSPATVGALELEIHNAELEEVQTRARKKVEQVEQQREEMKKERDTARQEVAQLQVIQPGADVW